MRRIGEQENGRRGDISILVILELSFAFRLLSFALYFRVVGTY
jgi:hypothetical protein